MTNIPGHPFLVRHDFEDIDELRQVARVWDIDFRQLNRGGFQGSIIQAGTRDFQIARTRLQGVLHQQGSAPPNLCTFAIPASGEMDIEWNGHEVGRNCMLVFPDSRELDSVSHPDFDVFLVSFTTEDLEAARHRLGIPGSEAAMAGQEMVCCRGSDIAHLRRWVGRSLAAVIEDPESLHFPGSVRNAGIEAGELVVRAIVTAQCEHVSHRSTRRRRLVEHAIRLAHDNADTISSVAELSRESGASLRTLRRGFQERFGVSPKAYLMAQRLNGARRDIRSANKPPLITDVANSWDFWHMGQFAADYRTMFGELPSETLEARPETLSRLQITNEIQSVTP